MRRQAATDDEAAALLEQVAKLRAEAAALENDLPKKSSPNSSDGSNILTEVGAKKFSKSDIVGKLEGLPYDAQTCRATLDACKSELILGRWDSVLPRFRPTNLGQLARIGIDATTLGIDSDDALEELKNSLGVVVILSGALAVASLALIGGNLGASLTYIFAVFPIIFLGVGSTNPGLISGVIESIKTLSDQGYEERRLTHEAAHFLLGYILGMPIAGYNTDSIAPEVALFDTKRGDRFDGEEGTFDVVGLSEEDVDLLSVVALAGAVAECQYFNNAKGVQGDLVTLNFLMSKCDIRLSPERQQSQTRWAAITAHGLLESNREQLEALVEAFRKRESIAACIAALETAA